MFDLLRLPGIKPIDLRSDSNKITIVAEVVANKVPTCDRCGKPMYRHGKRKNIFSDTPMEMQPVRLEVERPRYRCDACKCILVPELDFLDERRRATKRLVDAIRERCLGTTFHDMADHTGLSVNSVKNIALDMIKELDRTVCYETPVILGIDEVNLAGGMRCVLTNLATNNVFNMLPERTQDHLKPFFKGLRDRERVEWVCTDMWRPFKRSFAPYLPNAKLVIDKFHVLKAASEALETERKICQVQLSKNERIHVKKSIRWITLKRPENLTLEEQEALLEVRRSFPAIAQAYDLKEMFYRIYDDPNVESAKHAFEAWENSLPDERGLEDFKKLAKTVHNHYDDIFMYWHAPVPITNAYTECLNGIAKLANRMGRGYSYDIIRAKVLYAKYARKVGSGVRITSASGAQQTVEYGPHIPTLVESAEAGEMD